MRKILLIGDITGDTFIFLEKVEIRENFMCMFWGGKIPYKSKDVLYAVGNSPNAAVSSARLGNKPILATWTGDDEDAERSIKHLASENVDTSLIKKQKGKTTNMHYALSLNAERTILIQHEKFDYELPKIEADMQWVYLSSVGENASHIHDDLIKVLKKRKEIKLVFQPGTYQMRLGYERLKELYMLSELVVCNKEEAQQILETKETDMKILLKMFYDKCGNTVSITDGVNGAYATDGNESYYLPKYKDIGPPVERTGAGDAYTSTLTNYLMKGFELKEAMLRAPINSMNVVQHVGAQGGLLTETEIEEYLKNKEDDYKVSVL